MTVLYNFSLIYFFIYYALIILGSIINIKVDKKIIAFLNLILFTSVVTIAYNFIPTSSMDLYRYYQMLDGIKGLSLEEVRKIGPYTDTPITNFYFYWVARFQDYSIFSAIPTGMTFGLVLIVSKKYHNKVNFTFRDFSFYMIALISSVSLIGIVSGVRQNLAWSFLMVAVYYDYFVKDKNKFISIILYIVSPLVHMATLPVILIRALMVFLNLLSFLKYLIVLWPMLIGFIQNFSHLLPLPLQNSFERLGIYANQGVEYFNPLRIISVLILYLIILIFILNIKKANSVFVNKNYLQYYSVILVFGISSIFAPHLFSRIFNFLMFISLPVFSEVFRLKFPFRKLLIYVMVLLFIFLFIIQDILPGAF